jgi:hypothetical protein
MKNLVNPDSIGNKIGVLVRKVWSKKIYRILIGGVFGAGVGWLYWEFIGCNGGSCPLTSNAPQTIFIFTLFGMWFNYRK